MDALTNAAFESLVKDVLPKLVKELQAAAGTTSDARVASDPLKFLLGESYELLLLLGEWAGVAPGEASQGAPVGEMSDDDAMALLASEGVTSIEGAGPGAKPHKSMAASLSDDDDQDKMSDVAAGDMSDDEAMKLLSMMDAPADAPPAPEPVDGNMSDEEAQKLLAMMDAPLASGPTDDGEMSDDEARKLLALMDEPAAPPAEAENTASADDEALALLAAMGGADDHAAAAKPAKTVAARAAATAVGQDEADDDDGEKLEEIEETAKNDFASDPDMMNDFSSNTAELMETLDAKILELEQNPTDRDTIESIFRAAHTLKGAAGMFGFKAIERVMHRMENLFDLVRKGTLVPTPGTIDVVFQGIDVLKTLLEGAQSGKPTGVKTVPIVRALELAAKGKYVKGSVAKATNGAAAAALTPPAADGPQDVEGAKGDGNKKKKEEQSTIRVDLERLDRLVNLVGELVIDRTRFASIEEEIRVTDPSTTVAGNMSETVQLFGRHMNEIHDIIMKIRMVPIGNAFNKFTRIIRDLSRQLGKEIELMIDGEDTELDKTLVEQIGDPLIHLIRNSCDHGIEMPDERVAAGKPAQGKIFLSARQEGNHIIITIEDDGKGMDVDRIRKKAVERGLIPAENTMTDREIVNLIFEPGFSTAEKVTTVSGRGVGMDVVRKQISKIKGLIDIETKLGSGTTTAIRLPLTLAIVQSLLIEAQGECFAIPLSAVVESVRLKPEEIQRVGDAEVIKRHGKVLPLMHLHETLDLTKKHQISWSSGRHRTAEVEQLAAHRVAKRKDRLYVVIVGTGDRRFGIVVDQLLHQQEMVIKPMGPIMKSTPCVAGGAVLGNGEVVLVLDIHELEEHFRTKARNLAAA